MLYGCFRVCTVLSHNIIIFNDIMSARARGRYFCLYVFLLFFYLARRKKIVFIFYVVVVVSAAAPCRERRTSMPPLMHRSRVRPSVLNIMPSPPLQFASTKARRHAAYETVASSADCGVFCRLRSRRRRRCHRPRVRTPAPLSRRPASRTSPLLITVRLLSYMRPELQLL